MPEPVSVAGETRPLADERVEPQILNTELVFEGRVWDVRHETFDYNGKPVERDFVDHTGAVGVLAVDDEGRALLIRQYRHPIRKRDWEIPAGLLDLAGESPLIAAQRELEEEVDLAAEQWKVLGEFHSSPGGSTETVLLYLARGLREVEHDYVRADEEADMERRWVPLDEIIDAVLDRRVQNSLLIIAALTAHVAR